MAKLSQIDPAEALVREIKAQSAAECRSVVDAADQQGDRIKAAAFTAARIRAQAALADLRQSGAKRLGRAAAQIETERRLLDQARAAEILHTGCPSLINVVVDRWHDPALRQLWVANLAQQAKARLLPGAWVIEHPRTWCADDASRFSEALGEGGAAKLEFIESDGFEAGLRIVAGETVLDGTPERLLADKVTTQARLLAEMDRESVVPVELLGGRS